MTRLAAEPGSVSHGTLRPADLIETFYLTLAALAERDDDAERRARTLKLCAEVEGAVAADEERGEWAESEEANALLNEELFDALDAYAPDGHYFGAHVGDGADFGFWPCEDDDDDRGFTKVLP